MLQKKKKNSSVIKSQLKYLKTYLTLIFLSKS